jgi:hypothetical protein
VARQAAVLADQGAEPARGRAAGGRGLDAVGLGDRLAGGGEERGHRRRHRPVVEGEDRHLEPVAKGARRRQLGGQPVGEAARQVVALAEVEQLGGLVADLRQVRTDRTGGRLAGQPVAAAAAVAGVEGRPLVGQAAVEGGGGVGRELRVDHLLHQVGRQVRQPRLVEAVARHLGARLEGVRIGEEGVEPAGLDFRAHSDQLGGAAVALAVHRVAGDAARLAEQLLAAVVVAFRQLGRRQPVHRLPRRLHPQEGRQGLRLAIGQPVVGHPGARAQALGIAQPGAQPAGPGLLGQPVEVGRRARPALEAGDAVAAGAAGAADQRSAGREQLGLGDLVAAMAGAARRLGVAERQERPVPVLRLAVGGLGSGRPPLPAVAAHAAEAVEARRRVRRLRVEGERLGRAGHGRVVGPEMAAHAAVDPVVEGRDP